jgi:hypothetical protein
MFRERRLTVWTSGTAPVCFALAQTCQRASEGRGLRERCDSGRPRSFGLSSRSSDDDPFLERGDGSKTMRPRGGSAAVPPSRGWTWGAMLSQVQQADTSGRNLVSSIP